MNDKNTELLTALFECPGMYVGTPSLKAIAHFLDGYRIALRVHDLNDSLMEGWVRWIEKRFNICSPAWHWTRILEHHYGSEVEAIKALPQLFKEFTEQRQQIGSQQILNNWEKEFGNIPTRTPD